MKLWVVIRVHQSDMWEFMGVYDTQAAAEARCTADNDMVGPCFLNDYVPDETSDWPGAYYPTVKQL